MLFRALQVTRQVFEASKGRLKVVGRAGVGVDNVDLAAATEVSRQSGIWLSWGCSRLPTHGKQGNAWWLIVICRKMGSSCMHLHCLVLG